VTAFLAALRFAGQHAGLPTHGLAALAAQRAVGVALFVINTFVSAISCIPADYDRFGATVVEA